MDKKEQVQPLVQGELHYLKENREKGNIVSVVLQKLSSLLRGIQ